MIIWIVPLQSKGKPMKFGKVLTWVISVCLVGLHDFRVREDMSNFRLESKKGVLAYTSPLEMGKKICLHELKKSTNNFLASLCLAFNFFMFPNMKAPPRFLLLDVNFWFYSNYHKIDWYDPICGEHTIYNVRSSQEKDHY